MTLHSTLRVAVTAIASIVLVSGCADLNVSAISAKALGEPGVNPNAAQMGEVGKVPPAPERKWPDPTMDANDHRAKGWGLVSMPEMDDYLNGLLSKIKTHTGHPDWPGRVYILADTSLNADSSAAGNIYISLGWLENGESEDEIFAILSHEFGHVYLNHHEINDIGNAGDAATQLAAIGWALAKRHTQVNGWSGIDNIAMIQMTGSTLLMPAWKRNIEEQADRFGATVSLDMGYSYTNGFKTFLERIASYEEGLNAKSKQQAAAQDQAAFDKIRADTVTQMNKGIPPTPAPQPSGIALIDGISQGLSTVQSSLVEVQVSMNQGKYSASHTLQVTLTAIASQAAETHGDALAREDDLSKAVAPMMAGKPRAPVHDRPWEQIRAQKRVRESLAHYAMLEQIQSLEAEKRYVDALKLARVAASGSTQDDGMPDFYLAQAVELAHAKDSETAILMRNTKSLERSWQVQQQVVQHQLPMNRAAATTYIEAQFEYFGRSPYLWPDMITFYKDAGSLDKARAMRDECTAKYFDYAEACRAAAKTPSEIAQEQALSDQHSKAVANEVTKKWFKQQ